MMAHQQCQESTIVKAQTNQSHPLAMFDHCAGHSFNLAVSKSCSIHSIRNCLGNFGKS